MVHSTGFQQRKEFMNTSTSLGPASGDFYIGDDGLPYPLPYLNMRG